MRRSGNKVRSAGRVACWMAAWAVGWIVPTLFGVAWAGKAHEHGVARLDVAVQAGRVELQLNISLDDLAGFERAPRTDAERAAVAAVVARLQAAGTLFRFDPTAGCAARRTDLQAAVWDLGPAPVAAAKQDHADLEASYEFACGGTPGPQFVELGLFEALPRLKRIEVQAVSPKGQMKMVLRRPQARLTFAR